MDPSPLGLRSSGLRTSELLVLGVLSLERPVSVLPLTVWLLSLLDGILAFSVVLASEYGIRFGVCRVVLVASEYEIRFEIDLECADDV